MTNFATLRARAEAATPGPWTASSGTGATEPNPDSPVEAFLGWQIDQLEQSQRRQFANGHDAAYIAAADPQTILRLLDLLTDMVDCLRWDVEGHPVKYPIIPAGNGRRFGEAATAAHAALAERQAPR